MNDISINAVLQTVISSMLVWAGYTLQRVSSSLSSVEAALKELEKRVSRLERERDSAGNR